MEVRSIGPSFGMAMIKTKEANRLINRLSYDDAIKIKIMEMDSLHNPVDFYLSTIQKNGKERLKAEIGAKTYVQNFFRGPVKVIRKAFNYANKINEEQQVQNKLTEGMARPVLG